MTFMQEVYKSAKEAVMNEPGKSQIKGLDTQGLVDAVGAMTDALDKLPPTTNLHVMFFAVTYVRNAVALAMEEANKTLLHQTGGSA